MNWQQLSLNVSANETESLVAFFESAGAVSVTFQDAADQPLFEPDPGDTPLWSETKIIALFDDALDVTLLTQQLAESFGAETAQKLQLETLEDRDWERVWLEDFHPMQFGKNLWICPAGLRPENTANAVIIDLDPGLAFGTGTHPTTALCLEWLDAHLPTGLEVLDFGCGSGVLGIAALKLGADRVLAADIDEQALWATGENAQRNQVAENIQALLPEQMAENYCADIVLANILANPLIELASLLSGYVKPQGRLVLSGILKEQAEAVADAYRPWFDMLSPVVKEEWVRLEGIKRNK